MTKLIYLVITAIFFPIYIQFQGRDAITTGGLATMVLAFVFFIRHLLLREGRTVFKFLLFSLTVIGLISTFSVMPEFRDKSIRHFVEFFIGLLLFFITCNYYRNITSSDEDRSSRLDELVGFLLMMVAVQISIGLLVYFYPPSGKAFVLFVTRVENNLVTPFEWVEGVKRLRCLIGGGEELGELLAVLLPLLLYKTLFNHGSRFYYIILFLLYCLGILLTATRSAILLSLLSTFVFLVWNYRNIRLPKILALIYFFAFLIGATLYFSPAFYNLFVKVMLRFNVISETYAKTAQFSAVMNRQSTWEYAIQAVWPNLNLFGNGMLTILNGKPFNFHNLYLTLIYKFGIIGVIIHIALFLYILVSLIRFVRHEHNDSISSLASSCIISFSVFLINEIKFEFNRGASYQQIIWVLFAIYWLAANQVQIPTDNNKLR